MKRYKLLKDLPFAKAGEILELWSDGTMAFTYSPNLPRFNKKDVSLFPHWFEEVQKPETLFRINYFDNEVQENELSLYTEHSIKNLKLLGNYFKTREEAEKHLEWLKARAVLIEDTKGFEPDWYDLNELKYRIEYDYERLNLVSGQALFSNIVKFISRPKKTQKTQSKNTKKSGRFTLV